MSDGKIYITISDTRGGSGAGVSNDADASAKESKSNLALDYAKHKFFNLVKSEATRCVNYTVSNYGNFTGDYIAQSDIQGVVNAVNFMAELGSAIATGAQAGGWIGALVATAVFGISKGVNFGLQERAEQIQQRNTNRNLEMMRQRLGIDGLQNGSRTGGY